jgi:hypothetical protein
MKGTAPECCAVMSLSSFPMRGSLRPHPPRLAAPQPSMARIILSLTRTDPAPHVARSRAAPSASGRVRESAPIRLPARRGESAAIPAAVLAPPYPGLAGSPPHGTVAALVFRHPAARTRRALKDSLTDLNSACKGDLQAPMGYFRTHALSAT